MTTILFIRDDPKQNGKDSKGKNQVSGYIDLADRMKTEDFRKIFLQQKRLMPKTTDLSYYNWDSQVTTIDDTANFRSDPHAKMGL